MAKMSGKLISTFVLICILAGFLSAQPVHAAGLCYVNDDAGGSGNGSSWANAYTSLQPAISASCTEIWVAAGVYKPHASDRTVSFNLESGTSIYGGFAGTETLRSERNPSANITILSGDIDNNDLNSDANNIAEIGTDIAGNNSYHVVYASSVNNTTTLDGFIITAGKANGAYPYNSGGGIFNTASSPVINDVVFSGNYAYFGAGMSVNTSSNPEIKNSSFIGNTGNYGGGIYSDTSNPSVRNTSFIGNEIMFSGGGVYTDTGTPLFINTTFKDNTASQGGGMYNYESSPTLINATFDNNTASTGSMAGGILNNSGGGSSTPVLINVIIANSTNGDCINILSASLNVTSSNNLIEDSGSNACNLANAANGNIIGSDPNFGTLTGSPAYVPLNPGSPAIDAGTNANCASDSQNGVTRPVDGNADGTASCDMGSFEYTRTELLTNGGFNIFSKNLPKNWKAIKFTSLDGKTTTKKEGSGAVKIIGNGATKTLTQVLNISGGSGEPFKLSVWVKGAGIPKNTKLAQVQVLFYTDTTKVGTQTVKFPSGTYNWKQKTLFFNSPAAYNKVIVKFSYSKAGGTIYIDGTSLSK